MNFFYKVITDLEFIKIKNYISQPIMFYDFCIILIMMDRLTCSLIP